MFKKNFFFWIHLFRVKACKIWLVTIFMMITYDYWRTINFKVEPKPLLMFFPHYNDIWITVYLKKNRNWKEETIKNLNPWLWLVCSERKRLTLIHTRTRTHKHTQKKKIKKKNTKYFQVKKSFPSPCPPTRQKKKQISQSLN